MIAAALGIPADGVAFTETTSDNPEPVIQDDAVDFVVATYTINESTKQRISFAGPYYEAGQMLMVARGQRHHQSPEDLEETRTSRSARSPARRRRRTSRSTSQTTDQLVLFDVYDKCVDALKNGRSTRSPPTT